MNRSFIILGSLSAFIAVAAGAFGAHLLKKQLETDLLAVFETAVRYQMYHALALILTAILTIHSNNTWATRGGWLFTTGTILFSGSLYVLSLTGVKWFGAITPLGGIAFLAGWICLAIHASKQKISRN